MNRNKGVIIIGISSFILLIFLFLGNFSITGFTIFQSQPASEGEDTYIRQDFPNNNFGSQTTMQVGRTGTNNELRSLVYFDLSAIPSSDTISSANLSIYLTAFTGSAFTINAYLVTKDWQEPETTWSSYATGSSWSSQGGDYSTLAGSASVSSTGQYNLSITSAIRSWLGGDPTNYGLILLAEDAASGSYATIASSDHATSSFRPQIIVDHTDNAPPTLSLLDDDSEPSSPTQEGHPVTFTATWEDLEGNSASFFVCNSSNITGSGCAGTEYCSETSESPTSCQYTTQNSDNTTLEYWAAVCDTNCSSPQSGFFYVNHYPSLTLIQPNGGETINQSQGNYLIKFNISDYDSNTLSAKLYYGATQNSTTYSIDNISLSSYCTDADSNTATPNNCSYSWNSIDIHGNYYITVLLNDSYSTSTDSSNTPVFIRSLIDNDPPIVSISWTETPSYSGKTTGIYATILEENIDRVWAEFNFSHENSTLVNLSNTFTGNFTAPSVGTYQYRIHANDTIGNSVTSEWQEFSVSKPVASASSFYVPETALPYHTIIVRSTFTPTDPVKNLYAYLNVPSEFTFLSGYPQNFLVGNISSENTTTWSIATPLSEGTYRLNVTYTDGYNNQWSSSSSDVKITSAIGGYELSVSGYPEVETSQAYYAESQFKQSGSYTSPDSMQISIYDPMGSLIVGPASMTQESTGQYNYSYVVGASATEGQWETKVNATKSSASYYANQFWKVIGGPFDVRDITIIDPSAPVLNVSFVAENTGGANKDLIVSWNLTRLDTGALLNAGGETFMVPANSQKTWYILPETTYIGQVKISILGYYSGTEKAGAYKIFSTTEGGETPVTPPSSNNLGGGGGGGGAATPAVQAEKENLEIIAENPIYLSRNLKKEVIVEIKNTGEKSLSNLEIEISGLDSSYYEIITKPAKSLKAGDSANFVVKFIVTDFTGDKDFLIKAKAGTLEKTKEMTISVLSMKEFFDKEILSLRERLNLIKNLGDNEIEPSINLCEAIILKAEKNAEDEEYLGAQENVDLASDCITRLQGGLKKEKTRFDFAKYGIWIALIVLVLILVVGVGVIAFIVYKKLSVATFIRNESSNPLELKEGFEYKKDYFNKRLRDIEEKLHGISRDVESERPLTRNPKQSEIIEKAENKVEEKKDTEKNQ